MPAIDRALESKTSAKEPYRYTKEPYRYAKETCTSCIRSQYGRCLPLTGLFSQGHLLKSPVDTQKSPTDTQKRPTYRALGANTGDACD